MALGNRKGLLLLPSGSKPLRWRIMEKVAHGGRPGTLGCQRESMRGKRRERGENEREREREISTQSPDYAVDWNHQPSIAEGSAA